MPVFDKIRTYHLKYVCVCVHIQSSSPPCTIVKHLFIGKTHHTQASDSVDLYSGGRCASIKPFQVLCLAGQTEVVGRDRAREARRYEPELGLASIKPYRDCVGRKRGCTR